MCVGNTDLERKTAIGLLLVVCGVAAGSINQLFTVPKEFRGAAAEMEVSISQF